MWTTIGDVFIHNTGKALNASNNDGVLMDYITTSNLYWDRFDLTVVKQMLFTDAEKEKCTVKCGDLLVCEGGDIGRAAIWSYDYEIRIQNHIHRLRGLCNISHRFYYYIFLLYKMRNFIGGKGVAIQGLSSNDLHKLVVPLPPIKEQLRIVRAVEDWFSVIDKIEQEKTDLENAIKQAKSKILALAIHGKLVSQDPNDEPAIDLLRRINPDFKPCDNAHYKNLPESWTVMQVSQISKLLSGRDIPNDLCNEIGKGIPYLIGASNIVDNDLEITRWTEMPQVIAKKHDVLISCKGTIGQIIKNDIGRVHIARQFMAIQPNADCIDADYLLLCVFAIVEEIKKDARGVIPGISRDDILLKQIPIPPINEQQRIYNAIKQYNKILDNIIAEL